MSSRPRVVLVPLLAVLAGGLALAASPAAPVFDVRVFGAKGDGQTVDTQAINAAIEAATTAGGGTVYLSAGTYPSYSIQLKSQITLELGPGATLLAATPAPEKGRYDLPEPNEHDLYQDFGHSHWQNSLIWGIGLEDVAIVGPGRIDGAGLTRRGPGARWSRKAGDRPLSMGAAVGARDDPEAAAARAMDGQGNKALSLKLCRNVLLRDFSVLNGGHFAVLATGVDNLTIDNLAIDTNRDGLDIDACRNVRISNSSINSPNDDAIVLKSSYALGVARATENVAITNCQVSGYDLGTFLDGTFGRTQQRAPDRDGPTGRIKLGTESSGGFRNIVVSNCVFDRSRGVAVETVDGRRRRGRHPHESHDARRDHGSSFLAGRQPRAHARRPAPGPDASNCHQQRRGLRRRPAVPGADGWALRTTGTTTPWSPGSASSLRRARSASRRSPRSRPSSPSTPGPTTPAPG